jgi:hypothetical protein
MKVLFTALLFLVLFCVESSAQITPQRKVIMTLSPGETLYYGEHYVPAQFSADGQCTYITESEDGKQWLYFRGKKIPLRIEGFGDDDNYYWDLISLRPEVENGYVFVNHVWGEKDVVVANIRGKIYGPYEQLYPYLAPNEIDFGMIYYDKDGWYTSLNGIVKGPFNEMPESLNPEDQLVQVESTFDTEMNGDKRDLLKNGDVLVENIQEYAVSPSGKNVAYAKGNEIIVHGSTAKQKIPEGSILSKMAVNDAGQVLFEYRDNLGKVFVQTSSKKWGPYSSVVWSAFDGSNVVLYYRLNGRIYCSSGVKNIETVNFDQHPRTSGYMDPLGSFDGNHSMQFSYEGVTIDEQFFPGNIGIQKWYDPKLNAFVWTSLEENQIVLYTYTLH